MSEPERVVLDLLPLASLPMREWPALARTWLEEGYHSQRLADFAALSPAEAHVLAPLMVEVLHSIGTPVESGNGILDADVFEISGLAQRCRHAIEPVAADLEQTWKPIPLRVMTGSDEPPLFVQVIIGKDLSSSSEAMTASMNEEELVAAAATQVSEAFLEVAGYQWPYCRAHGRRMVVRETRTGSASLRPVWRCDGPDGHTLGEVGQLRADDAGVQETWGAARRASISPTEADMVVPPLRRPVEPLRGR